MSGPFNHVASLNLFREDYGHEITVAGAVDRKTLNQTPPELRPIDHIENLIIAAAERMRSRKIADGTYRPEPPNTTTGSQEL